MTISLFCANQNRQFPGAMSVPGLQFIVQLFPSAAQVGRVNPASMTDRALAQLCGLAHVTGSKTHQYHINQVVIG